ncbi:MAG: prephenate dehydrogenase [Prolixibacteraceae bacterium]|jgi:prephenate dehydrogenase|nr:prephenate dehydrogenase [Prolixibacteraceae bacterium]MBT6766345.1 prephenate dehydrogenase [Prolixibacteraceae bacterium]MBT6999677.1 prephenate dehydrogenase [Prolixibacteraceae bacterium]MBT7395031.1 prephenate dehydrogenase [Prolixibacteraceae bacterium]
MKTTIIGLGLIGGSLAKDLRKSKFATELIGVDANKNHAKQALELGLVDQINTLEEAVKNTDLIIIAIPVDKELEVLPVVLDKMNGNATVSDMGSAKKIIVDSIKNHPRRKNFVPAHPMSGTENSGPTAALEDLFKGKIAILCDQENSGPQHLALIEKMFQSLGMNIAYMSADEQDHSTAFVSHLPHAAAYALANAVQAKEDRNIIFDLASGGFRSTVRLAKSSSSMWHPIFQQNSKYVIESLDVYIKHLQEFRDSIKHEQYDKLKELIVNANKIRVVLDGENSHMIKNEEKITKFYTK